MQTGAERMHALERRALGRVMEAWGKRGSGIEVLGPAPGVERLPIVSIMLRHCASQTAAAVIDGNDSGGVGSGGEEGNNGGRYLHYNFVCALLNDLFGIQSRGGCACAGPYGQALLGIDPQTSAQFEARVRVDIIGHARNNM